MAILCELINHINEVSISHYQKKVICITGSSSGLGLHLAKKLSKKNIVYATCRQPKQANELLLLKSSNLIVCPMDVLDKKSIEEVMNRIKREQGKLDVLVNNAGIMHMGFFEEVNDETHRKVMETNFFGATSTTSKALSLLKVSKKAKIINISSTSGVMAMPTLSSYAASKWALEGWSEGLRLELLPLGIQVLLIEPGLIETPLLHKNLSFSLNEGSFWAERTKKLLKRLERMDPKRFLSVEEVSKCIEKRIKQNSPPFRTLLSSLSKLKLFIRRVFPYSFYEKLILNFFK